MKRLLTTISYWNPPVALVGTLTDRYYRSSAHVTFNSTEETVLSLPILKLTKWGHRPAAHNSMVKATAVFQFKSSLQTISSLRQAVVVVDKKDSEEVQNILLKKYGQVWSVSVSDLNVYSDLLALISKEITTEIPQDKSFSDLLSMLYVSSSTFKDISVEKEEDAGQVALFIEPPRNLPVGLLLNFEVKVGLKTDEVNEDNILPVLDTNCSKPEKLFKMGCLACSNFTNCLGTLVGDSPSNKYAGKYSLQNTLEKETEFVSPSVTNMGARESSKLKSHTPRWRESIGVCSVFNNILSYKTLDIIKKRQEILRTNRESVAKMAEQRKICQECKFNNVCYSNLVPQARLASEKLELVEKVCIRDSVSKVTKDYTAIANNAIIYSNSGGQNMGLMFHNSRNIATSADNIFEILLKSIDDDLDTVMPYFQKYGGYVEYDGDETSPFTLDSNPALGFLPAKTVELLAFLCTPLARDVGIRKDNSYMSYEKWWEKSRSTLLHVMDNHDLLEAVYGKSKLFLVTSTNWQNMACGNSYMQELRPKSRITKAAARQHMVSVLLSIMLENKTSFSGPFGCYVDIITCAVHRHFINGKKSFSVKVPQYYRYYSNKDESVRAVETVTDNGILNLLLSICGSTDISTALRILRSIKETLCK
jgi:hypothetical protein